MARYILRFLQAEGAIVALAGGDGRTLKVAAAEGSLTALTGMLIPEEEDSLVMRAITRERIEVGLDGEDEPLVLLAGRRVQSGAAAPLRAHGFTMGALAVADHRGGPFTAEDLWLLSTVTTHVAVVMANSRLFEMVRQAKEEWETAFNALTEGIAVVDADGMISRANRALARLVDQPSTALIGKPFWATLFGEAEPGSDLISAVRRGERSAPVLVRSETLRRVIRLTAAPLLEPADQSAVVVLVEDVTEQQALEAQVIQSEKLAAVGQLVSGVAHELNNPLTSIAGLSEFLLERAGTTTAEREHLRVIHEQADRAGRIVRNLLTFARRGVPEQAAVDLNEVLERTAQLIAYELTLRDITLKQQRSPEPLMVQGDRYELQQVLLNLLTNAVQAVGDAGSDQPRRIQLETLREGASVIIRVRDSGPGVPPALVPNLFTPFFTTKQPGEGTGLGLWISFGIVEAHGGKLSYAQAEGGGSEFTLVLPCREATGPGRDRLSAPTFLAPALTARRILLVDDDQGVQRMVTALFAPAGDTVTVIAGGDQALALAEHAEYDLVLADPRVALAQGRSFIEALAAARPEWRGRMIMLAVDQEGADRLRQEGYRVVERPLNVRALRDTAAELLSR